MSSSLRQVDYMSFDDLKMASFVFTPEMKLVRDIKRYVLIGATDQQIELLKENHDKWKKLVVLTERMEFIESLELLNHEIVKRTHFRNPRIENGVVVGDKVCQWMGHDFAGTDKDMESLLIYLLLSSLDELSQNPNYKTFDSWIEWRCETVAVPDLKRAICQLKDEYKASMGMADGVRRAFRDDLSESMKAEWTSSYCALKLRCSKSNIGKYCFLEKDFGEWNKADSQTKLMRIVSALLNVRNAYTHKACRMFECDTRLYEVDDDNDGNYQLVRIGRKGIIELLKETIKSIAIRKFGVEDDNRQ